MIIDAQVHEPVAAGPPGWDQGPAVAAEILVASMDAAGVDRAILTSARREFVEHACHVFPHRLGHLAEIEPDDPDPEAAVAAVAADPAALGLRIRLATPPQRRLTDPPPEGIEKLRRGEFDPVFAAAQNQGMPTSVYVSGYLPDLFTVCERFPGLHLLVDHLGLLQPYGIYAPPSETDTPAFRRLGELLELAAFPNVSVKVSGLPTLSARGYPFTDVVEPLLRVLDAFGPTRLLWGSDIQRCRAQFRYEGFRSASVVNTPPPPGIHTYAEALHYLRDSSALDEDTKHALLGGNALRLFGWADQVCGTTTGGPDGGAARPARPITTASAERS